MSTDDAPGRTTARPRDVVLEVRDLRVHYGLRGSFLNRLLGREAGTVKAVDGVSLELQRGEVLGLVGESGSGKTTLGRAILSLVKATDGAIYFDGQKVSGMAERKFRPLRRRMQLVFQDPHASLNPSMTLLEAVGHPIKIHKVARSREQIRAMVSGALERVGLVPVDHFLNKYPSDLSGGQKQRAVLARAIILGPELVVADEPVSMLDMSVRAKVLQLMVDLKRDLGLTYLYITHDLATARFLCDRIAIMYLGRIVEIGPAHEVFARPRHPYTKSLLAAIPEPDPRHRIPRDLPRGEVPDAATPPLGCSFHPRCPQAFGPCGWESRDVRALLEARWAALGPTEFRKERPTIGDLSALSGLGDEVHVPAGRGHNGEDVAQVLEADRAEHPDEPLWRGIESMFPEPTGVRIRFRRRVDPVLQHVDAASAGDSVAVACHLHRADLSDSGSSWGATTA